MNDRPVAVSIRPLTADDGATARALFTAAFGNTLYAEAPRDALRITLASLREGRANPEARGLVVDVDGQAVGVAIYGEVAGAVGAGKIHGMAVAPDSQRHGLARMLIEALSADLASRGARFVLVAFPDAAELTGGRTLLLQCQFVEESRVPNFFVDGVALAFLRRELGN
jgi:ribosomal protein S18 acetylase RimI-like enzyme